MTNDSIPLIHIHNVMYTCKEDQGNFSLFILHASLRNLKLQIDFQINGFCITFHDQFIYFILLKLSLKYLYSMIERYG